MRVETRNQNCGTIAEPVEVRATVVERLGKIIKEEVGYCDHVGKCGVKDSDGNCKWAKWEHELSPRS